MKTVVRTLKDIQFEKDELEKRLKIVMADLEKLHDKEHEIRTKLQHLEIQIVRNTHGI